MRHPSIFALAAVLLLTAAAHADPASTLKQEGLKAAKDKNWDVARERFEQSYALDPRPLTLFNLAVAQEHTDKLVEARASYAAFLEQPAAADSEPFRKLARNAIPPLDKAIPTLQIRATGLVTGDVIELDGRAANIDEAIALDPGSHTVAVRRGGEAIVSRSVVLIRAARDTVELAVPLPPVPPPRVSPPPEPAPALSSERPMPPPPREHRGILRSRWFWGATAIAVLAAAGATYYYLTPPTHDPTKGTLDPGVLRIP
jgi:hypothetical protein